MRAIAIVLGAVLVAATVALAAAGGPPTAADGAPGAARPPLVVLELQGPATAAAESTQQYTLIARYADGTVVDVTERADWQVDARGARVVNGTLTVARRPEVPKVTVSAWFTDGLSYKASRTVVLEVPGEEPRGEAAPVETVVEPEIPEVGPSSRAPAAAGRGRAV